MLFAHQQVAADWIAARPKAYLGDVPGLGKTRSIIDGLWGLSERALVVCPAIVRTHWRREIAAVIGCEPGDSAIKSYDEIVRGGFPLMAKLLRGEGFDALVLDEAHYLKHAGSQRTQILLGKDGYARRMPRVVAASGTPQPKHPGEMWTILSTLFPEVVLRHGFRTAEQWRQRFCITRSRQIRGVWVDKVVGQQNVEQLREILSEVMLRRTLDDVGMDVPEIFWQTQTLDAGDVIRHLGDYRTDPVLADLNARLAYGDSIEHLVNDPHVAKMRRLIGELKVAPVVETLSAQLADSEEKVVVFAHHTSVLNNLRSALGSFGVAFIDGSVSDNNRASEIDRFQTDPRCRIFLGQNIACETGVTLTASRRVVLVEPDWSGYRNVQLGKRVARIGQTAARCIGQMVALAGTLDEAIVRQSERETRMANEVLR